MAADYDTKVYVEVGGDKLVVADGGEIELQSGATFDVQSGANFDLGSFGTSMVVTQTDNYPLGVFGTISTAQTTGSVTQRGIWARMDVDANLSGTSSVMGAELQFRFDGATSIGSGVEAEQYTGAWLYFEQDTSGDTLADYCHASASFASVETHSDLSLSANTHLSGIEIASRLGTADGVAWADTTGTTAALFITKAPAAAGVTASNWPYGIFIENTTTAISIADCTTGISFPAAFTGTNAILIAGTSTDAIKITGTPSNSDIMLHNSATISNIDNAAYSGDVLTLTEDAILLVGTGWGKIAFGGLTDWGTGATGTRIDGGGYDWVTGTVGNLNSGVLATAVAAAYHAMTVNVNQTTSTSVFGTWTELYIKSGVDLGGSDNYAATWGQVECLGSVTTPDTGNFMAAMYGNFIAPSTFTIATGVAVNGFRAQLEAGTITAAGTGRTAAFECLATDTDWDYGLYTAGAEVGIQVTDADRVLLGGGYSTADNLPMTTDNHYLVGIFGKMATTEDITLEQRVILGRLGIVAGVTIGSAAGWGQGMSGVKGHIAFYGGSDTETYCWHNAGVFGHIQADGVQSVNFKDGSHTACFYGHAGLVAASGGKTVVDTGAVIAGIALHSGIGSSIDNSGTIAAVYIYKDTGGNLDWPIGIDINNSTTGMDIGACTTGIDITGVCGTACIGMATGQTIGLNIAGTCSTAGISMGALSTAGQAMLVTWSGVPSETTSVAAAIVSVTGTATADDAAGDQLIGYYANLVTSTAEQPDNYFVGFDALVESKHNIDRILGVRSEIKFNDASGTVDTGSAAVYAICNVAAAVTVTAGPVSGVWSHFSGTAVVSSANTSCFFADMDDDITHGIDMDVASGKTCTTGIELGVSAGAYTTGINISGACDTGISIPSTAATDHAISIGILGTEMPIFNATNNYQLGVFTKVGTETSSQMLAAARFVMNSDLDIARGSTYNAIDAYNDYEGDSKTVGGASVHSAIWAHMECAGATDWDIGANVWFQAITAGIDLPAVADAAATSHVSGIRITSDVDAGATMSGDFAGLRIDKQGGHLNWTIGIDINNATTGIDIGACTKAFAADSVACASGGYGMSVVSTLTSGASEGIAGYFEAHVAGTPTGLCFGLGSWVNVDTATVGCPEIRAIDAGIYAIGQDLTGTNLVGINIDMHASTANSPQSMEMMRFNCTVTGGSTPDAWFRATGKEAIAYTNNSTHTGAGTDKVGAIAIKVTGTTADPGYIYVYSHPGQ